MRGLKYQPFLRLAGMERPGAWIHTFERCPCCRQWAQAAIQGEKVVGLKHRSFADDQECPWIQQQNALPTNRFQRLVQDYRGMESRLLAARDAVLRQERHESRLDGRPKPMGPVDAAPADVQPF